MLTGVLVFLLLLIGLLAIPITLTFQVFWSGIFQKDVELRWAFGLVRVRIPATPAKVPSQAGEDLEQTTSRSERRSRKNWNILAAVRLQSFRRRIIRFIGDIWRAVHKKDVSLRVRVGLGDPADTGQLWSILGPVAGMLANIQEASVTIEPEFVDATLEVGGSGSLRLIPLQMIYLTSALLLSPPVWQGVKHMRMADR